MSAIAIEGLVKDYGKFRALNGLNLDLAPGQVVGLLGENGCGKTTLLKILAGALTQYEGSVLINSVAPGPESKAQVSFLPDASFLPDSATVEGCLRMYSDFFADFRKDHAVELISDFGIDQDRKLDSLSKGMREKVQIALAMAREAKVYLLDEPISGVDPAARDVLLQAILRNLDPEALVVISTHLIHDLEPILDAVAFMRHGQVLLTGGVDDLRAAHAMSIDALFREVYR